MHFLQYLAVVIIGTFCILPFWMIPALPVFWFFRLRGKSTEWCEDNVIFLPLTMLTRAGCPIS